MHTQSKNYFLLHLIVFLWGFTAILGKLITVNAIVLVWYRVLIAALVICGYMLYKKVSLKITIKQAFELLGVGCIIALHWYSFYHAVKVSNVAVTLGCFSLTAFFTSVLEPLFFKRKIRWYEVMLGMVVIVALLLIFKVETKYKWGIILSIFTALTSATFSVLNGLLTKKYHSSVISFYEMISVFIISSIVLIINPDLSNNMFNISGMDWTYLLILSIVCTALTFVISVEIMKYLSPYTINLTLNLESIYGIVIAYFIWDDEKQMTWQFYVGAGMILATVFANGLVKKVNS